MTRAAWVALAVTLGLACRAPLPRPRMPLVPTPHEAFRDAPPAPLARLRVGFPAIEQWSLPNGMQVYLLNRPGGSVASVQYVCRRAGEDQDDVAAGMPGLAIEMLARSTERRLRSTHTDRGLVVIGDVSHDASDVEIVGEASAIDRAIQALAYSITAPLIQEDSFERIRARMVQQRIENPDEIMFELAREGIYGPAHPYTRPLSGRATALMRIRIDEVGAFVQHRFVAAESALVVAGPFAREQIAPLVERAFGAWVAAPAPPRVPVPVIFRAPTTIFLDRPRAATSMIVVGIRSVARTNQEYAAMALLDAVLGGLFSSRANLALREQGGYAYSAHSLSEAHRYSGMLLLTTEVATDQTVPALRELLASIERVRRARITEQELLAARETWRVRSIAAFERPLRATSAIADLFTFGLPLDDYETLATQVRETSAATLLSAGADRLAPAHMRVVVAGDHERIGGAFRRECGPVEMRYLAR